MPGAVAEHTDTYNEVKVEREQRMAALEDKQARQRATPAKLVWYTLHGDPFTVPLPYRRVHIPGEPPP